jgi:PUA domain protein
VSNTRTDRSLPFYAIKYTPKDGEKNTFKIEPLVYETKDHLIPHLKLVHKYPQCFPRIRIDRGAIRFVLSGATLMAPGLTSPGGRLPSQDFEGEDAKFGTKDLEKGVVVVVEAEGKEEACLVGALKVGTGQMKVEQKGAAIEDGWHYVGDGLWKLPLD